MVIPGSVVYEAAASVEHVVQDSIALSVFVDILVESVSESEANPNLMMRRSGLSMWTTRCNQDHLS